MALKFCDGFDHYATADLLKKWTAGTTGQSITANGRNGGSCFQGTLSGSGWTTKTIGGTEATVVMGAAIRVDSGGNAGSSALGFFQFKEGSTVHVSLSTDVNGAINAYRGSGSTLLGASANGQLVAGSYVYVEAKVKVHDTTGTVEVRVNGSTVLNLTGQDTRNAGTGFIDTLAIGPFCSINPTPTRFDDLYILDTTGSAPRNDFLGDCTIETLFPNGEGNYLQLTPSTGSTHYLLVDEATPNTTDYNSSATAPNKDTYQMAAMSGTTLIYALQVLVAALKDAATATNASTTIRSSSTDADGVSTALATTQSYLRDIWQTDPATSAAWVKAGVDALEVGMKVTVSGANARASQAVVEVLRSTSISLSSARPNVFVMT